MGVFQTRIAIWHFDATDRLSIWDKIHQFLCSTKRLSRWDKIQNATNI